jgi:hypothetical protein
MTLQNFCKPQYDAGKGALQRLAAIPRQDYLIATPMASGAVLHCVRKWQQSVTLEKLLMRRNEKAA